MKKKLVIITGSGSGIGRGTSEYLKTKYDIIGLDIKFSSDAHFNFHCDITNDDHLNKLVKHLETNNLKIFALINNAAVQVEKGIIDTNQEELLNLFKVNVFSIFNLTNKFLPFFEASSSIINISSVHSKATSAGIAAYAASKGAVSSLTRAMAIELGSRGIKVNSISPGAIDTEMLRKGLNRNNDPKIAMQKLINSSPINRIGQVDDIALLVDFLIDEKNLNITGQDFFSDSGVTAKLASE